eukprot:scaffold82195_cov28-Tisochrysis_lutea.AAC.1
MKVAGSYQHHVGRRGTELIRSSCDRNGWRSMVHAVLAQARFHQPRQTLHEPLANGSRCLKMCDQSHCRRLISKRLTPMRPNICPANQQPFSPQFFAYYVHCDPTRRVAPDHVRLGGLHIKIQTSQGICEESSIFMIFH